MMHEIYGLVLNFDSTKIGNKSVRNARDIIIVKREWYIMIREFTCQLQRIWKQLYKLMLGLV